MNKTYQVNNDLGGRVYLYTENFFWRGRLKNFIKRLIGRRQRGPQAVFESLCRGLKELKQPFGVNQKLKQPVDIVCILSGVGVLKWAIAQKQKGLIKKIIAGPNIVITPLDENGLILSAEIDSYVVPSQWSVDWWLSLVPQFKAKLRVWPTGVEDKGELMNPSGYVLVFNKNVPKNIFNFVLGVLSARKTNFQVINYGTFTREEYFRKLSQAKFMIYLSTNESQGLALHEAWIANVPTLVWNPKILRYKGMIWGNDKITAPYLEDSCGVFFEKESDFEVKLDEFEGLYLNFHPRDYSLEKFTDKVSAQNYLDLIKAL